MTLGQKICHFHSHSHFHSHFHFQLLRNNWICFWLSDSALAVLLSQIFKNFTFFYSLSHLKLSHWEDISKHCYVIIGSGSGSESGSGIGSGRFFDLWCFWWKYWIQWKLEIVDLPVCSKMSTISEDPLSWAFPETSWWVSNWREISPLLLPTTLSLHSMLDDNNIWYI